MLRPVRLFVAANFLAAAAVIAQKPPVDSLIPWLLQEDAQLRGIPFGEVIFDATGKKVIPFDAQNETDQRVVRQITAVLDEVVRRLNAPDSVIQGIPRINEASSHFEDTMRELLNAVAGLSCDFPRTAEGLHALAAHAQVECLHTVHDRPHANASLSSQA